MFFGMNTVLNNSQVLTAALIGIALLLFIALSVFLFGRGLYLKLKGESASIFAGRPLGFCIVVHCFSIVIFFAMVYAIFIEPTMVELASYDHVTPKLKSNII